MTFQITALATLNYRHELFLGFGLGLCSLCSPIFLQVGFSSSLYTFVGRLSPQPRSIRRKIHGPSNGNGFSKSNGGVFLLYTKRLQPGPGTGLVGG